MKKKATSKPGYNFSNGVRGKYADRFLRDAHIVILSPEIAAHFPDSASVNLALRKLIPRPPKPKRRSR
jgi:hypothetical protein